MHVDALAAILEQRYGILMAVGQERSVVSRTAREIIEMTGCYLADGFAFQKAGDHPNALASLWYAAGWADAGLCLGYLSGTLICPNPCTGLQDLPDVNQRLLESKSLKYEQLLARAISFVSIAPEPMTPAWSGAGSTLLVAKTYLRQGRVLLEESDFPGALSLFSYGHGWLDAAVRSGLLHILGQKEIFPV